MGCVASTASLTYPAAREIYISRIPLPFETIRCTSMCPRASSYTLISLTLHPYSAARRRRDLEFLVRGAANVT